MVPHCFGSFSSVGAMAEGMNVVLPDLHAAILCEDVRAEASGQQSLIGVLAAIPAPVVPIGLFKLCLWTRWGGGVGRFQQRSLIVDCDDENTIAKAEIQFEVRELESHATNVHIFGGLQFKKHGVYYVEIYLDDDLRLRFPLPVVPVAPRPQAT